MNEKKLNKYLYELHASETNEVIKNTVDAENLMQAFNILDGIFGLDNGLFKEVSIELLRKNV